MDSINSQFEERCTLLRTALEQKFDEARAKIRQLREKSNLRTEQLRSDW
jgi:hypothetical protein